MKNLLLFLCISWSYGLMAQNSLETKLFDLPGVSFKPIAAPEGYEAAYELRVRQPIDHQHPEKGHFYQRVFLSHRGFDRPTVMATEGYQRSRNRMYEPSIILQANQLDIEHRYFGESIPLEEGYDYLTLEQATADLHRINQLFRNLYREKWVSTGISKGGQTTIMYRYFYPDDVEVSIPYVAPLNLSLEDTRIYDWLSNQGSEACRESILNIQKRLLSESEKALPFMRWYAKGAALEFDYMTIPQAYEYAILEYPFSLWQWGTDCNTLPDPNAPLETLLDHLIEVVGIAFYADRDIELYGAHYYQAATQMGYYGFDISPFKGLLVALPDELNPNAAFSPVDDAPAFDGTLMKKVSDWLKKEGNNFIYIYGANDTWSATGVPPSKKTNSLWVVMEGKHHGNARIRYMTTAEKAQVEQRLEEWLQVDAVLD